LVRETYGILVGSGQYVELGGTIASQTQFLDIITPKPLPQQGRRPYERQQRQNPAVANRFGLGYTYQDVMDVDQEGQYAVTQAATYAEQSLDTLARLCINLLANTRSSYAPLLSTTFTPENLPHSLAVILLDWEDPWNWLQQLLTTIQTLKAALSSLDPACQDAIDEVTALWQARLAGPNYEGSTQTFTSTSSTRPETTLPPRGPGELDTPLGIPLIVLCHNAEYTHTLAREHGWSDTRFDFILQTLRTILLKHDASLIYTSSSDSSKPLTDLIHSSLAIHSLIRKAVVKPEAIVRDQILIPAHWDTWGKIKTLDAEFDVEGVSTAWGIALDQKETDQATTQPISGTESTSQPTSTPAATTSSLFATYEQKIRNPRRMIPSTLDSADAFTTATSQARPDYQAFLASQLPILKRLEAEDAAEMEARQAALAASGAPPREIPAYKGDDGSEAQGHGALDFVGPVQINVGGVTVDVEAALQGMRDRAAASSAEDETETANTEAKAKVDDESAADKKRLEWFATLASRRKSGGSSIPGSPAGGKS